MKLFNKVLVLVAIALLIYGVYYSSFLRKAKQLHSNYINTTVTEKISETQEKGHDNPMDELNSEDIPLVTTVVTGLDTPWAIAFLPTGNASQSDAGWPDGSVLVTERNGTVRLIKDGELIPEPVANINTREIGEGGLMGIAVHPDFNSNHYVYVYYTYRGDNGRNLNRVTRFTFVDEEFTDPVIILDGIAAASNHNGGRLKFGPDKMLYLTVGDAQDPSKAQDTNSLSGKILRMTDGGKPAPGNPFNNLVYSYGHRNPQGLAWDKNGQLWSTEHGPSGDQTGNDEFNKIEVGKNYGWPEIKGAQTADGMETPILESGFLNTWAPAGLAYLPSESEVGSGKFYFAGLRGASLYELDEGTTNLNTYFKGQFGRLREVVVGPDNMLYVTTSNLDGRGNPKEGDDKILRINPNKL